MILTNLKERDIDSIHAFINYSLHDIKLARALVIQGEHREEVITYIMSFFHKRDILFCNGILTDAEVLHHYETKMCLIKGVKNTFSQYFVQKLLPGGKLYWGQFYDEEASQYQGNVLISSTNTEITDYLHIINTH
jgi:hypothetical protein